jgi:hypothetical protein
MIVRLPSRWSSVPATGTTVSVDDDGKRIVISLDHDIFDASQQFGLVAKLSAYRDEGWPFRGVTGFSFTI